MFHMVHNLLGLERVGIFVSEYSSTINLFYSKYSLSQDDHPNVPYVNETGSENISFNFGNTYCIEIKS